MTLWQVLVVVAVAWFSGALFGVGLKDLRAGRDQSRPKPGAGKFGALAASLESEPTSSAPTARADSDRPQRPHFWFVDEADAPAKAEPETAVAMPSAAMAERAGADPAIAAEPVTTPDAKPTATTALLEATLFEAEPAPEVTEPAEAKTPDKPSATARKAAKAQAAREGGASNTVSSVRMSDEPFVMPSSPGRSKKKKRGPQSAVAKQIAHWRAQDRAAQSRGVMFWVEIGVLILLLVGASWAVVYFATQPVAGLR